MYVHEAGPADATTIVFLHGGGLSGRMWQPQFEGLPQYRCIAPDLPEQGRSSGIAPFLLEDATRRVAELIQERVSSGRAHIVGLSLGGAVGLSLMRDYPSCVDRLLVSGTAAGLGRVLAAISRASTLTFRLVDPEKLIDASAKSFGIPPRFVPMFREDLRATSNAAFMQHMIAALQALKLPPCATSPTLVVVGERETWTARRAARQLIRRVQAARGFQVPKVGHVWNLEAPDLFTALVRAWIEDTSLPSGLRPLR
ncbi:MAG TPA: alpha/beta hydrolase [Herpetosiphonaceae bacterium]